MIKQTTAVLLTLAFGLSAHSETPEQTRPTATTVHSTIEKKNIVKFIDFTHQGKAPLGAEVLKSNEVSKPSVASTPNHKVATASVKKKNTLTAQKTKMAVAKHATTTVLDNKTSSAKKIVNEKKVVMNHDFTNRDPFVLVDSSKQTNQNSVALQNHIISKSTSIAKATTYSVRGKTYRTLATSEGFTQQGKASWYGPGFHGRKTASGEIYNMNALTAAHKRLPLGTKVEVTNLENGKSVIVRITDRGPFHGDRVIDLSKAAAKQIGVIATGIADVSIRALK